MQDRKPPLYEIPIGQIKLAYTKEARMKLMQFENNDNWLFDIRVFRASVDGMRPTTNGVCFRADQIPAIQECLMRALVELDRVR